MNLFPHIPRPTASRALRLGALLLCAGVAARATSVGEGLTARTFERYSPIIGRMPFGQPPPPPPLPPAATNAPVDKGVDLARSYVLSGITRMPSGDLAVGFTDNGAKPPRSLLLAVGEEGEGYRVVTADIDAETATLEKDGTRISLQMAGRSLPYSAAGGPAGAPPPGVFPPHWPRPGGEAPRISMGEYAARRERIAAAVSNAPYAGVVPGGDSSYLARLRERREVPQQQAEEERKRREQEAIARAQAATKEEIDKRLRETNLNLIRKGLKPIGTIQLTPEEDAKLVAEGVLPAQPQ